MLVCLAAKRASPVTLSEAHTLPTLDQPCNRCCVVLTTCILVASQPAEEPEWTTSPFELCAVDGHLYGRGTSDNKGPVLAFVYAIKVGAADCHCRA